MKIHGQEIYEMKCSLESMQDKSTSPLSDLGKQVVVEGGAKVSAPKKMAKSESMDSSDDSEY